MTKRREQAATKQQICRTRVREGIGAGVIRYGCPSGVDRVVWCTGTTIVEIYLAVMTHTVYRIVPVIENRHWSFPSAVTSWNVRHMDRYPMGDGATTNGFPPMHEACNRVLRTWVALCGWGKQRDHNRPPTERLNITCGELEWRKGVFSTKVGHTPPGAGVITRPINAPFHRNHPLHHHQIYRRTAYIIYLPSTRNIQNYISRLSASVFYQPPWLCPTIVCPECMYSNAEKTFTLNTTETTAQNMHPTLQRSHHEPSTKNISLDIDRTTDSAK